MIWQGYPTGIYSTRSGYNWLMKQNSEPRQVEKIWNKLNKMHTLPKIKIFDWRLFGHKGVLELSGVPSNDSGSPIQNVKEWLVTTVDDLSHERFTGFMMLL
ncbi:hypothetical protein V6N13_033414 [Hibiscus sabdariffa]